MSIEVQLGTNSNVPKGSECFVLSEAQFEHYWPKIVLALDEQPELWNLTYTKEGLKAHALSGLVKVWVVCSQDVIHLSFMTRRLLPQNEVAVLQVFWAWGNGLKDVLPLIDLMLDRVAAVCGCGRIEGIGRKGFEKLVKPLGYEYRYAVYSRLVKTVRGN